MQPFEYEAWPWPWAAVPNRLWLGYNSGGYILDDQWKIPLPWLFITSFWLLPMVVLLFVLFLLVLSVRTTVLAFEQSRVERHSIRQQRLPKAAVRCVKTSGAEAPGGLTQLSNALTVSSWLQSSRRQFWANLELNECINSSRGQLLVFVNPRSGGRQGIRVLERFRILLHQVQVVDLQQEGPEEAIRWWSKNSRRYRILVCGGDGTVGWVLSCLEQHTAEGYIPPVAILPLGTGNDLARVTGWCGGFSGGDLVPILRQVQNAHVALLDRWTVSCRDARPLGRPDTLQALPVKQRNTLTMCNYLGIGVDAATALDFHQMRERKPHFFVSRFVNRLWYIHSALKLLRSSNFASQVTLECDGVNVSLPSNLQGLIVLNIASFGGGSDLWGSTGHGSGVEEDSDSSDDEESVSSECEDDGDASENPHIHPWLDSSMNDRKLEVVGVRSVAELGGSMVGLLSATRIAQASHLKIRTRAALPIQVDGEPWVFEGQGEIEVSLKGQAFMLAHMGSRKQAVATDIVEWAVEEGVIGVDQRNRLMREIANREQSCGRHHLTRRPSTSSFADMLRAVGSSSQ